MRSTRHAQCPNCGASIEFGLGASHALVCTYCNFLVVRTDRDLTSIGKVADLVPTSPPFEVGDTLRVQGRVAHVAGRVQKDFGEGPWDEFYVGYENGEWAWLASAQGRWYVTTRVDVGDPHILPHYASLQPGGKTTLGTHPREWTVMERRSATVVSARGEFPDALAVGEVSYYADLSGPLHEFATIDFGTNEKSPVVFLGMMLAASAVELVEKALGERPQQKIAAGRLSCPMCGGLVEIVSNRADRIVCRHCCAILDCFQGTLVFAHMHADNDVLKGSIPLGKKARFRDLDVTVIGIISRAATTDAAAEFGWHEYLLYADEGYFWLIEDGGHYTFVRPIEAARVSGYDKGDADAFVDDTKFHLFFHGRVSVRRIAGEFYWKVRFGETVEVRDYIAPPLSLSIEKNDQEVVFSICEHVPHREVLAAFGAASPTAPASYVPAGQPNPYPRVINTLTFGGALFLMLMAAFLHGMLSPARVVASESLTVPASHLSPTDEQALDQTLTFDIRHRTTLALDFVTDKDNIGVDVVCALVDESTQKIVRVFDAEMGKFHGYSDGENWSEGSLTRTIYVSNVKRGRYSIRTHSNWQPYFGAGAQPLQEGAQVVPPTLSMTVRANAHNSLTFWMVFTLLCVSFLIVEWRALSFERRRWRDSNVAISPPNATLSWVGVPMNALIDMSIGITEQ